MTLDRLMVLAVLGMLVTGASVYALTRPRSDEPSKAVEAPPPPPVSHEPDPSPAPSDTAPTSSAPVAPAPAPEPSPTLLPSPSADASRTRNAPPPPSAVPSGAASTEQVISALTTALGALAQEEAPGMYPQGTPLTGRMRQGETLERSFQLISGKCHAVLAIGFGMGEVDIELKGRLPGASAIETLVNDNSTGPIARLGSRGNCYKWPFPNAPGKYVIRATAGQGTVAAQLYVK